MKVRKSIVRAVGVAFMASAVGFGATGVAQAQETPRWEVLGPDVLVVGDNAFCNGAINTRIVSDPASPGKVTAILTPLGMNGIGPEWDANPVCNVTVTAGYPILNFPFYEEKQIPLSVGRGPQEPTVVDLHTRSGLNVISFHAFPMVNKLVTNYVMVP